MVSVGVSWYVEWVLLASFVLLRISDRETKGPARTLGETGIWEFVGLLELLKARSKGVARARFRSEV